MYNHSLDVLIKTAETGSFTKAASALGISSTAVMKTINELERRYGFTLMERTPRGIHLTAAGESLYRDALQMVDFSEKALRKASALAKKDERPIRICFSSFHPATKFFDLISNIKDNNTAIQTQLSMFPENEEKLRFPGLGSGYDFLFACGDPSEWGNTFKCIEISKTKRTLIVPASDPVSKEKIISLNQLIKKNVYMHAPGVSSADDRVREFLSFRCPRTKLIDSLYLRQTLDDVKDGKGYLLASEALGAVEESLVNVPVDWPLETSFCLLCSLKPRRDVQRLVELLEGGRGE